MTLLLPSLLTSAVPADLNLTPDHLKRDTSRKFPRPVLQQ